MTPSETDGIGWRKSTHSADNGGCVEVGWRDLTTAVRDSKETDGPTLGFPVADWRAFLATLPR